MHVFPAMRNDSATGSVVVVEEVVVGGSVVDVVVAVVTVVAAVDEVTLEESLPHAAVRRARAANRLMMRMESAYSPGPEISLFSPS